MDKIQGFMAFTTFSVTLLVLTIPLWLDSSMPYILSYYQSSIEMLQELIPNIKLITDEIITVVQQNL